MVVKFVDAKKSSGGGSFFRDGYEKVSVRELVGKTIQIEDVEFKEGLFGEAAVVYLVDKRAFMTSSNVLLDQIRNVIKPYTDKGEIVEAGVAWATGKSGRRYLTFV